MTDIVSRYYQFVKPHDPVEGPGWLKRRKGDAEQDQDEDTREESQAMKPDEQEQ